ncbi:MAG: YfiR family protein [Vicinamibacterales bacterium]
MTVGQRALRGCGFLLCVWLGLWHASRSVQAAPTPEYLIKAAYLYNFALFVEWPADAFPTPTAPIVIGVVGADPFEAALDRTIRDKRVNNRPVVVKRLGWAQDLRTCHILFVSSSEAARAPELRTRLDGLPILLVGETPEFARRGGTINFTIDDNKVKLEVNVDAARRARLNISAKLLRVARIVRGG